MLVLVVWFLCCCVNVVGCCVCVVVLVFVCVCLPWVRWLRAWVVQCCFTFFFFFFVLEKTEGTALVLRKYWMDFGLIDWFVDLRELNWTINLV